MSDKTPLNPERQKKDVALFQKRKEILSASPEKALEMILDADLPATLVQSFSPQDLYFLSHDIGIADALPVLSLATSEQWGYMIDVEVWEKDSLDLDAVTRWFRALLLADGSRLVRWLMVERLEFFELYLFRNIEVIIREKNQDPSDIPDGFFTVDDWFYVRVREKPEIMPNRPDDDMISQDELDIVVRELLEKVLEIDHALYQNIMLEAMSVIPAETEEDVFHMRNVRLAEEGFLPFDEALEIYSPLTVDQIEKMTVSRKSVRSEDEEPLGYPLTHVSRLENQGRFSEALALIEGMYDAGDFAVEFAALCNQIIAADQNLIRERETLGKIVKKAVAYLNIGFEILGGDSMSGSSDNREQAYTILMNHSLKNLFRLGMGRVLDLKFRAERFKRDGWFTVQKLPLSFWGEAWLGVLGGLLVKYPVFYSPGGGGPLYREFESLADVEKTEQIFSSIKNFDDILSLVSPGLESFRGFFMTYANVLLTVWVSDWLAVKDGEGPVDLAGFRSFFENLWKEGKRSMESPGEIRQSMKENFLGFLAGRSGLTEEEISKKMGFDLEDLFEDIVREYGAVDEKDLDPRYLTLFCVVK